MIKNYVSNAEIAMALMTARIDDPIRYPALTIMPLSSPDPIPVAIETIYYVERTKDRWRGFWFNTPNGYREGYEEEPVEGGDDEAWANAKPAVLHNGPHEHDTFFGLHLGQQVEIRGRVYRIEPTHNGNLDLVRV